MLAEVLVYNRIPKTPKKAPSPSRKRAISIMKSRFPEAKCDKGGCKNHDGRCAMDDAWDQAMEIAQDELSGPEGAA